MRHGYQDLTNIRICIFLKGVYSFKFSEEFKFLLREK